MSRIRRFFIRFEILGVSVLLLATFVMLLALMIGHNRRWDLTQEKIYSLSRQTVKILKSMQGSPLEILAFYPTKDENKTDIDVFLKEAAIIQGNLKYRFYDPQKQPALTRELGVKDIYTILFRYKGREERIVLPDEEDFATALVRLIHPREIELCSVTGHGEAEVEDVSEKGLSRLTEALRDRNLKVRSILLAAEGIPSSCSVVLVPGPQKNWTRDELELIRKFYVKGKGVLFLIDPTDKQSSLVFDDFLQSFGVKISSNVIVDKMSRAVGGDFLVPFVNHYNPEHPLTRNFQEPTFFPVTRTVDPLEGALNNVSAVAFSGSNSWAESNLSLLEQGEAVFEVESDTPGPLSVAVALTPADAGQKGRMVVVGDSDFLSNAYLDLSANRAFALESLDWLANDDRKVIIDNTRGSFVPFTLTDSQQFWLFSSAVVILPAFFLVAGAIGILWRHTRS